MNEEKKAIANFKYWIDTNTERGICYLPDYICVKILTLIEKLQKENEEKTTILLAGAEKVKQLQKENEEYSKQLDLDYVDDNYIAKQKIKEKIEELSQYYKKEIYPSLYQWSDITIKEHYDEMIALLQELIEEREEK